MNIFVVDSAFFCKLFLIPLRWGGATSCRLRKTRLLHRNWQSDFSETKTPSGRKSVTCRAICLMRWAYGNPVYSLRPTVPVKIEGGEYKSVGYLNMSQKQMKIFNYQLLEGRLWDSTDVSIQYRFIINETAKKTVQHNRYSHRISATRTSALVCTRRYER